MEGENYEDISGDIVFNRICNRINNDDNVNYFSFKSEKPKFERLFCAGIILGAIILGGSTVMLGRNILNPIEINRISEQSTEGRTLITMKEKISNMKPGKYTAEMILYDRTTNQPVINDNGEIAKSVFELNVNKDIIISEECHCDMDIYVDDIDVKRLEERNMVR